MIDYGTLVISRNSSNSLISKKLNQIDGKPEVWLQHYIAYLGEGTCNILWKCADRKCRRPPYPQPQYAISDTYNKINVKMQIRLAYTQNLL